MCSRGSLRRRFHIGFTILDPSNTRGGPSFLVLDWVEGGRSSVRGSLWIRLGVNSKYSQSIVLRVRRQQAFV